MKDIFDILFDYIGDMFKLLLIFTIILVLLQYTSLYIVGYKTIQHAEENGFLSEEYYNETLDKVSFDTADVEVEFVSPNWGEKVYKLGDPLTLIIKREYKVTMFGREIKVPMVIKREGVNHGYYGEGYGDYTK